MYRMLTEIMLRLYIVQVQYTWRYSAAAVDTTLRFVQDDSPFATKHSASLVEGPAVLQLVTATPQACTFVRQIRSLNISAIPGRHWLVRRASDLSSL